MSEGYDTYTRCVLIPAVWPPRPHRCERGLLPPLSPSSLSGNVSPARAGPYEHAGDGRQMRPARRGSGTAAAPSTPQLCEGRPQRTTRTNRERFTPVRHACRPPSTHRPLVGTSRSHTSGTRPTVALPDRGRRCVDLRHRVRGPRDTSRRASACRRRPHRQLTDVPPRFPEKSGEHTLRPKEGELLSCTVISHP